MLFCLADGRARTSTELAVVAEVTPSTASVHLQRLKALGLVHMNAQGKHRYYALAGPQVAAALEALSVLAGGARKDFTRTRPGICASRARATTTSRAGSEYCSTIGCTRSAGSRSRSRATAVTQSRAREPPDSRASASTSTRPVSCGAASHSAASTGASVARTSAVRWARRCWMW